jgi:3-hydroxyacyl-[acyl-carrier-protein] dehydratase
MPGVLIIEALAQAASVLLELSSRNWEAGEKLVDTNEGNHVGVLGNVKINMVHPVQPGCLLYLSVKLDWQKQNATSLKVEAYVEDHLCAQGSLVVALVDKHTLL